VFILGGVEYVCALCILFNMSFKALRWRIVTDFSTKYMCMQLYIFPHGRIIRQNRPVM